MEACLPQARPKESSHANQKPRGNRHRSSRGPAHGADHWRAFGVRPVRLAAEHRHGAGARHHRSGRRDRPACLGRRATYRRDHCRSLRSRQVDCRGGGTLRSWKSSDPVCAQRPRADPGVPARRHRWRGSGRQRHAAGCGESALSHRAPWPRGRHRRRGRLGWTTRARPDHPGRNRHVRLDQCRVRPCLPFTPGRAIGGAFSQQARNHPRPPNRWPTPQACPDRYRAAASGASPGVSACAASTSLS